MPLIVELAQHRVLCKENNRFNEICSHKHCTEYDSINMKLKTNWEIYTHTKIKLELSNISEMLKMQKEIMELEEKKRLCLTRIDHLLPDVDDYSSNDLYNKACNFLNHEEYKGIQIRLKSIRQIYIDKVMEMEKIELQDNGKIMKMTQEIKELEEKKQLCLEKIMKKKNIYKFE
jgi:hypothetical protein